MKTGKKVNGECDLCIKPKEGEVRHADGVAGLRPMKLCLFHVGRLADLQIEETEEPVHNGQLFDRASA